jgi:hypothetical protein
VGRTGGGRARGLVRTGVTEVENRITVRPPAASARFPYGDVEKADRCRVLAAESRAGQYEHLDVEAAAAHLHWMVEGQR